MDKKLVDRIAIYEIGGTEAIFKWNCSNAASRPDLDNVILKKVKSRHLHLVIRREFLTDGNSEGPVTHRFEAFVRSGGPNPSVQEPNLLLKAINPIFAVPGRTRVFHEKAPKHSISLELKAGSNGIEAWHSGKADSGKKVFQDWTMLFLGGGNDLQSHTKLLTELESEGHTYIRFENPSNEALIYNTTVGLRAIVSNTFSIGKGINNNVLHCFDSDTDDYRGRRTLFIKKSFSVYACRFPSLEKSAPRVGALFFSGNWGRKGKYKGPNSENDRTSGLIFANILGEARSVNKGYAGSAPDLETTAGVLDGNIVFGFDIPDSGIAQMWQSANSARTPEEVVKISPNAALSPLINANLIENYDANTQHRAYYELSAIYVLQIRKLERENPFFKDYFNTDVRLLGVTRRKYAKTTNKALDISFDGWENLFGDACIKYNYAVESDSAKKERGCLTKASIDLFELHDQEKDRRNNDRSPAAILHVESPVVRVRCAGTPDLDRYRIGALDISFATEQAGGTIKSKFHIPYTWAGSFGTALSGETEAKLKVDGVWIGTEDDREGEVSDSGSTLIIPMKKAKESSSTEGSEFSQKGTMQLGESFGGNKGHTLTLELDVGPESKSNPKDGEGEKVDDVKVLYLRKSPFLVAGFSTDVNSSFNVLYSEHQNGYAWKPIARGREVVRDVHKITLPPQSLGESVVTEGAPVPLQLGEPTELSVVNFDTGATPELAWNLMRMFSRHDLHAPGVTLDEMSAEFAYGMRTMFKRDPNLRETWIRIAELESIHGRVRSRMKDKKPDGFTSETIWERIRNLWDDGQQVRSNRPFILQLFPAGRPDLQAKLTKGLSFQLLKNKNLDGKGKPIEIWPIGAEKPKYGIASFFPFASWWTELFAEGFEGRTGLGRLDDVSLSALGGWADQKAEFLDGLMSISTKSTMGRLSEIRITRIGRVACHWNNAKYVIVYKRLAGNTEKDPKNSTNYTDALSGIREFAQYVEITEQTRRFPEGKETDPRITGSVEGSHFVSKRVNVNASWGREIPTGIEIPLWKKGADSSTYPKPVFQSLFTPVDPKNPSVAATADNPEDYYFYSAKTVGLGANGEELSLGADSDYWDAVRDVDYPDAPLIKESKFGQDGVLPELGAIPEAPLVPIGYERFTIRLTAPSPPINIAPAKGNSEGNKAIKTIPKSITLARSFASLDFTTEKGIERFNKDIDSISNAYKGLDNKPFNNMQPNIEMLLNTEKDMLTNKIRLLLKDANNYRNNVGSGLIVKAEGLNDKVREHLRSALNFLVEVEDNVYDLCKADSGVAFAKLKILVIDEFSKFIKEASKESLAHMASGVNDSARALKLWTQRIKYRWGGLRTMIDNALARNHVSDVIHEITEQATPLVDRVKLELEFIRASVKILEDADATIPELQVEVAKLLGTIQRVLTVVSAPLYFIKGNDALNTMFIRIREAISVAQDQIKNIVGKFKGGATAIREEFSTYTRPKLTVFVTSLEYLENSGEWADYLRKVKKKGRSAAFTLDSIVENLLKNLNHKPKTFRSALEHLREDPLGYKCFDLEGSKVSFEKIIDAHLSGVSIKSNFKILFESTQDLLCFPLQGMLREAELKLSEMQKLLKDRANAPFKEFLTALTLEYDAAANDLSKAVQRPVSGAFKYWSQAVRDVVSYLESYVEGFKAPYLFAGGQQILRLARAVVESPIVDGLSIYPNQLAVYIKEGIDEIDLSPAIAIVDRRVKDVKEHVKELGKSLSAFSFKIPFSKMTDQIDLDLGAIKTVGDVVKGLGANFEALFDKFADPSTLRDLKKSLKVTHDHDLKRKTGWVHVALDHQIRKSADLFEVAGLKLVIDEPRIQASMRTETDLNSGTSTTISEGRLTANWKIQFGGMDLLTFEETALVFNDNGNVKFEFDVTKIKLTQVLQWVMDAAKGFIKGLDNEYLTIIYNDDGLPVGIMFSLAIPFPNNQGGTSGILNLSLSANFGLEIRNGDIIIRAGIGLSSPSSPFTFTVFIFGGAGWINVGLEYNLSTNKLSYNVVASLAGSACLAFAAGPITGAVAAYIGIAVNVSNRADTDIVFYFRVVGWISLAGFIHVEMGLVQLATYNGSSLSAGGEVYFKIKICRFFTIELQESWGYEFENSSGGNGKQKGLASEKSDWLPDDAAKNWLNMFGIFGGGN